MDIGNVFCVTKHVIKTIVYCTYFYICNLAYSIPYKNSNMRCDHQRVIKKTPPWSMKELNRFFHTRCSIMPFKYSQWGLFKIYCLGTNVITDDRQRINGKLNALSTDHPITSHTLWIMIWKVGQYGVSVQSSCQRYAI